MIVDIIDNHWLYLSQMPLDFDIAISNHFSAEHPRRRYIDTEQYGWDGKIRRFDLNKSRLALPFLNDLIEFCNKNKVPIDINDHRDPVAKSSPEIVTEDMFDNIKLAHYQIDAIRACLTNDVGIISACTGSGKGEMIAAVTKAYDVNTVIFADQRVVVEQLCERLKLRDVFDGDIGKFYGGSTASGQSVVVGSIQSLCSPPVSLKLTNPEMYKKRMARAKKFQDIVSKAELLLVDEVDKVSSDQYSKLYKNYFQGRFKFGFSGTPFDKKKPVQNLLIRERAGSIIYEVPRSEVEAAGRIVKIKLVMLGFGAYNKANDTATFDIAENEQIIDNVKLHDVVCKIVAGMPKDNFMILIDTASLEKLGLILNNKIPGSKFVYGKTSNKVRTEAVKQFESGELRCLIAGKIFKRGLDIKGGIDNLIYIGGGKLASNLNQICGRAVRLNSKGFSRVFGFMFLGNKYLYSHSREQLKTVIDMGYETSVVINDSVIPGPQFIKSYRRSKYE